MKHRSSNEKDSQFLLALRGVLEQCIHLWFLTEAFINNQQNRMAAEGGAAHNRKPHSAVGCMESSVHPCFSQSQAMCYLSPEGHIPGLRVGPGTRNKVSLLMPRSSTEKQSYTEVNHISCIFLASQ